MKKHWETTFKGHTIRVENSWFGGERLIVNGELQDERTGFCLRSTLWGRIRAEDDKEKRIKVGIGGWFFVNCRIFVDDALVFSGS